MPPLRILTISAEVAPFAKTGGLGDVVGALPKALAALGHDIRVVMPAYAAQEKAHASGDPALTPLGGGLTVPLGGGAQQAGVLEARLPGSDVPVYFIAERSLFGRERIYGYDDDPYRFAFLSRAALALTERLDWRPDVVHAHDWHAAPATLWLATAGRAAGRHGRVASVFTIHNLAHQGRCPRQVLAYLGTDVPRIREEGFGELNFMARGIYHADMVNTVSPTYAREIMTPGGGAGLDGLLRFRHFDVHGILNGLDLDVWDPATDPKLARTFDAATPERRTANKEALQRRLGLPVDPAVPLVGMVTRLDEQKGMGIVGHAVHLLMSGQAGEAQFVVLGTGAPRYEAMFRDIAAYHPRKMSAVLAFAPDVAPLIYGGSDMFLMPSRFEPCGLGQMIAMRYGSVPVVRATGGLADTVRDAYTGFSFVEYDAGDLWMAMQRALFVFKTDHEAWRAIQHNGMTLNFSWSDSARGYVQLYDWALARLGR
ncbi:MAG TPA: glycogen synthase [Candidatus Sulfotelmatobacter sp.]|jgi:starch synthase|nr:glycogen synthase [Candidatus Sulfotelmatobacter sp.]